MDRTQFRRTALAFAAAGVLALGWFAAPSRAAEDAFIIPPPASDVAPAEGLKTFVLAGGCFWGVQGVYQHTRGVTKAVSGYAGGKADTAQYEIVGSGRTGHAEAVQITYDPKQVTLGKLLQIYFSVAHDPTQLNRQGPDSGTQYRSTVFTSDPAERKLVEAYIAQLNAAKVYPKKIATTLEPLNGFYPAEEYHQDYLTLHPSQPYIVINDLPKIENLKKIFADNYRDKPALVRDARASN
ncbi:peptide-methionine (S)-S-oxide reductase MsrA [Bradyrhizobium sp. G127]|uniref:peptide-methionine (S)-S-oxide reductase MsrA n=1 Tax=Bradyrhizobium sp. G127 TaxID=2904800 RepID=UPI001F170198|nr:peptide-methionine (S)-S-oxide reductase MsrA [Bradyrhizobium sp. G127]MCF2522175.1 peptide-methionine (S)-S-oxide reductase MsrA [Bradyrhizobium sp. G127]